MGGMRGPAGMTEVTGVREMAIGREGEEVAVETEVVVQVDMAEPTRDTPTPTLTQIPTPAAIDTGTTAMPRIITITTATIPAPPVAGQNQNLQT